MTTPDFAKIHQKNGEALLARRYNITRRRLKRRAATNGD